MVIAARDTEVKPGYKLTEVGMIPEDWDLRTLEKLTSEIGDGIHSTPKYVKASDFFFVNGNNLVDNEIRITEETKCVSEEEYYKYKKKLNERTILLSINGTIGNIAFFNGEGVILGKSAAYLNINNSIDKIFIFYVLQNTTTKNFYKNELTGSTINNLSLKSIRNTPIPLPPTKSEQHAIATALSDMDALITSLNKLIAKKRDIKQATMQQLLTGKTRLPGFSEKWEERQIGEIFQFLSTANNSRSDLSEYGEIKYIHYGDIHTKWRTFVDCSRDELPLISRDKVGNIPFLEDGDLVMADASEDYEGIGISVEVKHATGKKVVAGLHTFLLRGNKEVLVDGFKGYLQYIPAVKEALKKAATGISVYGISKNNVKNISIRLPDITEQTAIATVLSDMDAEIAALEQRRDKTRELKQGMMQELLTGKTRLL
jgi:type I restriction enzyme, S subunit